MNTTRHAGKLLALQIQQQSAGPKILNLSRAAVYTLSCIRRATTQCSTHTQNLPPSRTGPKSGGGGPNRMRTLQSFCLLGVARGVRVTPEVRVGVIANIAPEVTQHGRYSPSWDGEVVGRANQVNACPYTWSAKRAYRRARARAAANGTTVYRGRIHDQSSLQIMRGQVPHNVIVKRQRLIRRPNVTCNHGRLRYLTWNISGASSAAYREFTCWLELHQSEWDVVLAQETHWKGDTRCYTTDPWHVVSTGAQMGDTSSGVAIFVHRRLASADSLSYRVHAQGRVLHVRIPTKNNSIDAICVYQQVWRGSCNTEKNVQNRQKIWQAVRQAIATVPLRNDFIMGGDFNTLTRVLPSCTANLNILIRMNSIASCKTTASPC